MGISGIERVVYPLKIHNFLNFLNYNKPQERRKGLIWNRLKYLSTRGSPLKSIGTRNLRIPEKMDNLGTMACFHPRYDLGDKHDWPMNREGYLAFMEFLKKNDKTILALPLYLYDHSGLRIKVGSFQGLLPQGHAEFDTMKVGYIYIEKKKVLKEFGVKKWNQRIRDWAIGVLESEVKTYDDYLSGNIFGFEVKDQEGEDLDSCWGFYPDHGEPGGLTNYVMKEAKAAVDHIYRRSMIQFNLFNENLPSIAA